MRMMLLVATLCCCVATLPLQALETARPVVEPPDPAEHAEHADLTPACRALQIEVQETVGNEDPNFYRNHGAYVSRVAHIVGPRVDGVDITEECASCIISQFARGIPVEEQEPCGSLGPNPECIGAECGTYIPCNPASTCADPVCGTTAEGGGLCVEGSTPCSGLLDCNSSADCPPGFFCFVRSCCERNVCVGPDNFCPIEGGPSKVVGMIIVDGPTISNSDGTHVHFDPPSRVNWGQVKTIYRNP